MQNQWLDANQAGTNARVVAPGDRPASTATWEGLMHRHILADYKLFDCTVYCLYYG